MNARSKMSWIAIAGATMLAVGASMGQRIILQVAPNGLPMQAANVVPTAGQDDSGTVYVRDSAIAMEKLALARRMERARQWDKSADVYQEILEKYSDRVVPAAEDPQSHIVIHYTSVTQTVRESLCKWPIDGLTVYRGRYETPAAALLVEAGNDDLDKLHEVMSRYFPADSAKAAGIRLMDIYFEQGDYAAVDEIGNQLLDWHPNIVAQRPMVLYRTALAAKLSGQTDDANRRLDELARQFPQATGTIRGQDVILADSLAKELAGAKVVRVETGDSWLTVGGDESRGRICTSTVKPGARLYTIPLMRFHWNQIPVPNREQMESSDDDQRKKGAGLDIMPVVDKGELFFQDNARIYAMDLDGGVPLPAWVDTYPVQNGAYTAPGDPSPAPAPLGKQLCVSVNDKYVVAVMGLSSDQLSPLQGPSSEDSRLVCLDRKTGKDLWTFTPRDFPQTQNSLRELRMGGAPLMEGDNVYVMVHGSRGQFEDCYVACFSLQSGEFRWATFIANSSNSGMFSDDSEMFTDAISHIAYAGGRLFVVSNIGAIASLDAYSGTIAWLNIYRTDNQPGMAANMINNPMLMRAMMAQNQPMMPNMLTTVPWVYNPAVVQNGKLFALPSDSHSLLVYDAGNGNLIKQIQLADSNLQETRDSNDSYIPDIPTTLLGVRGDLVYLAGARQVWQVPWAQIEPDKTPDVIPGYWRSADSSDPSLQVRGRGFVTADAVYLPTQSCLKRIVLSTGLIDSSFPKNGWEDGKEGPGNVIVTQDHVIVAGDAQVAVYTDLELARAKLDREIADAPADADVRLHYAEVMFAGAQPDVAQTRLEEAFELLGGMQALRPGTSRERAFNDALSFAKRSAAKNENPQQIDRFFDLAQAAAVTQSQQVEYRLARADFDWTRPTRDAGAAIELYQEILGDPAFRQMAMPDPLTANPSQAGAIADKAIQKILESNDGRQAYEKFEELAAQKLRDAKAAGDPDQLLDVAKMYPDSKITSDAMMSAAELYESRANPRMATRVLRDLLRARRDQDRIPVLESLARNYLKMPGHLDVAVRRIQSAANIAPTGMLLEPLTLPNGAVLANISLGSAREALARYEAQESVESLPDLHLPTHDQAKAYRAAMGQWAMPFRAAAASSKIDGVDSLVVPMEEFTRNDRLIAWSAANGLSVYAVGGNKPLFTCAGVGQAPLPGGAAWTRDGLVFWSAGSISLVDGNSGAQKWSVDLSKLPAIVNAGDAAPDNQNAGGPEEISQVEPIDGHIIVTTTTGRLMAIDSVAGRIVWQVRASSQINPLLASDDFTVIRYQDGQTVELEVYDSASGELLGEKSFGMETNSYPINLALAADGALAYTLPNQLCIQDLFDANLSPQGMDPDHITDAGPNPPIFQGGGQPEPDQLLIHGGRVFALAESGKNVRVFSIDTGEPWAFPQGNGQGATPAVFSTDSTSPNVRLRISGNYLFVFSPRNLVAYHIDRPIPPWESYFDPTKATNYQQAIFGRDYLALVDRPNQPLSESNHAGNKLTLSFFNRSVKSLPPDEEGGLLVFTEDLPVLENNAVLQAIDGGIAYFTGHMIQVYMGARDSLPNGPAI
jgi:outer membrane protein assembly factor BamB